MIAARRRLGAAAAALVIAIATGCQGRSDVAGLSPLKVVALPWLSNAPIFVAQDEGFFTAEGLAVEIVELNRAPDGLPALMTGSIDVVGGALTASVLNIIARGGTLKAVAEKGHVARADECTNQAVLVRRDLIAGGVFTPPQRRLVVASNASSYSRIYTERALGSAAIDIADAEAIDLADPLLAESFHAGRVDVATAAEPWLTSTLDSGAGVLWKSASEFMGGFQHSFFFYGPRLLDPASDLGVKFLRAYLRGVDRWLEGKTPRNLAIVAAHTRLEPAMLARACWSGFSRDGAIDAHTLDMFQEWAQRRGLIDRRVTLAEFSSSRYLDAIAATRTSVP